MKRLNCQCKEAKQIIDILENEDKNTKKRGWINHPAVLQWKNYLNALKLYYNTAVLIWNKQKKKDGSPVKQKQPLNIQGPIIFPPWLGNSKFHLSHQSNLLRKNKEYYSKYFDCDDNLSYYWPSKEEIIN